MPIKTVIIEDDAVFRLMIGKALRRMKGLVVTGEFADGREGLDFCLREKPDLLVVDLFLPSLHGLEIIKQVRRKLTGTLILVLTGRPDAELPAKLIAEGVNGFVDKTEPLSYMLQAVDTVVKGGDVLCGPRAAENRRRRSPGRCGGR